MSILESGLLPKARKIYSKAGPLLVSIWRALPATAWLTALGLILFLWFWIFGSKGLYEMERLRQLRFERQKEKENMAREQTDLHWKLKNLNNPEYQKHLIRRELGYIEPDEAVIPIPPSGGENEASGKGP